MDYLSWQSIGFPASIQEDLTDGTLVFGSFSKGYNLYLKPGPSLQIINEGKTLNLANETLILMRGCGGGWQHRGWRCVCRHDFGCHDRLTKPLQRWGRAWFVTCPRRFVLHCLFSLKKEIHNGKVW